VIEMRRDSRKRIPWFAVALCLFAASLSAGAPELDRALEKYYAGYPRAAVGMIEPLAAAGDVDAQYLLGNLLYTLARSGQSGVTGDPVRWYRLAAGQGSAPAAYALGAIHHNRWLQARRGEDLDLAESYYRQALDLGDDKARAALDRLAAQNNTRGKSTSLTYTNESFASKRQPPPDSQRARQTAPQSVAKQAQQTATFAEILAGLQAVDDPDVDTQKLQALLGQLDSDGQADASGAAIATLRQMLGGFESTDRLFADLLRLIGHLEAAGELGTAPGAN
jgi:hypothetical protein